MTIGNICYTNLDFEEIPYVINVAGVSWENRQDEILTLTNGLELKLIRNPSNKYDKYAIAVKTNDNRQIGWIPKDYARILSPEIDAGINWGASVDSVIGDMYQLKGVLIKLFTLEDNVI